ncbi:hypothetical protein WR25_14907 [Diploscapter pachys]|uniref:Uncharacterized protein n=1 Tax=Diploscapter pachys TaxID=2018661 RepID=A0A2A2J4J9_9BILA|nr:hypothetical protein WR25_14907 [Diploscapter pachys]
MNLDSPDRKHGECVGERPESDSIEVGIHDRSISGFLRPHQCLKIELLLETGLDPVCTGVEVRDGHADLTHLLLQLVVRLRKACHARLVDIPTCVEQENFEEYNLKYQEYIIFDGA